MAPELCRGWLEHADDLALVAPFGVPAEHIIDSIEAISWAVSRHKPSVDISAVTDTLRVETM